VSPLRPSRRPAAKCALLCTPACMSARRIGRVQRLPTSALCAGRLVQGMGPAPGWPRSSVPLGLGAAQATADSIGPAVAAAPGPTRPGEVGLFMSPSPAPAARLPPGRHIAAVVSPCRGVRPLWMTFGVRMVAERAGPVRHDVSSLHFFECGRARLDVGAFGGEVARLVRPLFGRATRRFAGYGGGPRTVARRWYLGLKRGLSWVLPYLFSPRVECRRIVAAYTRVAPASAVLARMAAE